MAKLTPWYPPHIKPLTSRPGVYPATLLIHPMFIPGYAYWDGYLWGPLRRSAETAELDGAKGFQLADQRKFWWDPTEDPTKGDK